MKKYGIFLDVEEHVQLWLSNKIKNKRVSLKSCPYQWLGAKVEVNIVAFGFDCDVAAFKVAIAEEVEHLADYPRFIVTSTRLEGEFGNPKNLEYTEYEKPIRVIGTLGYEEDGKIVLEGKGTGREFKFFVEENDDEEEML